MKLRVLRRKGSTGLCRSARVLLLIGGLQFVFTAPTFGDPPSDAADQARADAAMQKLQQKEAASLPQKIEELKKQIADQDQQIKLLKETIANQAVEQDKLQTALKEANARANAAPAAPGATTGTGKSHETLPVDDKTADLVVDLGGGVTFSNISFRSEYSFAECLGEVANSGPAPTDDEYFDISVFDSKGHLIDTRMILVKGLASGNRRPFKEAIIKATMDDIRSFRITREDDTKHQ